MSKRISQCFMFISLNLGSYTVVLQNAEVSDLAIKKCREWSSKAFHCFVSSTLKDFPL